MIESKYFTSIIQVPILNLRNPLSPLTVSSEKSLFLKGARIQKSFILLVPRDKLIEQIF